MDGDGLQLATVPVGGADTIRVVFSEAIDNDTITIDSLSLVGTRTGTKPIPLGFEPPTEANNFTASWFFPSAITTSDYYLLSLPDTITGLDGNSLDGDWTNPARLFDDPFVPEPEVFEHDDISEFPSGDGTAGGDFNFVLTFFPGDSDLNLLIDSVDLLAVLNHFFGTGVWETGDFDGDGIPDSEDLLFVLNPFFSDLYVPITLVADVYGNDNHVNQDDLLAWQAESTDLNGDGLINNTDLTILTNQMNLYFTIVA